MKKIFGVFAIALSITLITGCGKKEENNSNTNNNNQTPTPVETKAAKTITCTELDNEDTYAIATLDNDNKVVKIEQKSDNVFNSESEAQSAYTDAVEYFKLFDNIDGMSYTIDINGKVIVLKSVIEISKLKSFINSNPEILETLDLNSSVIETEEAFKKYATENNLRSCLTKVNQN